MVNERSSVPLLYKSVTTLVAAVLPGEAVAAMVAVLDAPMLRYDWRICVAVRFAVPVILRVQVPSIVVIALVDPAIAESVPAEVIEP